MNNYRTTHRTENAFEKKRLPVSACLFPLESTWHFPYSVEDDASTISQTSTTHYTNTCVKLTIVTHLSFSERVAIANLSFTCSGDHEQDRQPYRVEPYYSAIIMCGDHTYIHTYNITHYSLLVKIEDCVFVLTASLQAVRLAGLRSCYV